MASLPRHHAADSLSHNSPTHSKMSPRLPRKSRQHGAYASTSKLDSYSLALQVDQYTSSVPVPVEGRVSPIPISPNSPYTSRPHRRDRVSDRYGSLDYRQSHEHRSRDKFSSLDRTSAMNRYGYRVDGSLERGLESVSRTGSLQRNRSLDREYPLVTLGGRNMSDGSDMENEDLRFQQSQSSMLILSLQAQLVDLNKDYTLAQRELEQSKSQLNSYIASVKTFWSPELKKERALRKEETLKSQSNHDQLHAANQQVQVLQTKLHNADERLTLHDVNDLVSSTHGALPDSSQNKNTLNKEIEILQETIREMELRIDIQKKTLTARDASIKKLVEMLQTKNIPIETILSGEAEKDKLRHQIATLEQQLKTSSNTNTDQTEETSKLNETIKTLRAELKEAQANLNRAHRESRNMEELQAVLDIKNTRISELEAEMKELDREITEIRNNRQKDQASQSHIETLLSAEKILKSKIENMKVEVTSKNTEISSLENRLDSANSSRQDLEQTIVILNQKISNQETNFNKINNQCSDIEHQLKDRDEEIGKKNSLIDNLKTEKLKLESELADGRYDSEINTRKLQLLNKKLSNSEDIINEKSEEISSLEARIKTLTSDKTQNEALIQLEKQLNEKSKQLDRLKSALSESQSDTQSQIEKYEESSKTLSRELELLKQQTSDRQAEILELKDSVSELKSDRLRLESVLNQKQNELNNSQQDRDKLKSEMDKLLSISSDETAEHRTKIDELTTTEKQQSEQLTNYQSEIDRLLEILKEMENEKHNKDKQIKDLQEQVKDTKQKFISVKKQLDKKKSDENRKSGTADTNGNQQNSPLQERIDELEEALKQSVKITAKSEMNAAQLKDEINRLKKQLEQYKNDIARATEISLHVNEMEDNLRQKNDQVKKLQAERSRHMEEVYEMKQEAILAAISEKDSHIALLEASKTKQAKEEIDKLISDKQRLNLRLKDLTTQRMLLVVEQSSENSKSLHSVKSAS